MQMSLDEAHLILNVKKEDPLEIIEKVIHQSWLSTKAIEYR
jgi:hypothetical protein